MNAVATVYSYVDLNVCEKIALSSVLYLPFWFTECERRARISFMGVLGSLQGLTEGK